MIFAFEVSADLRTEKSFRDRVRGISAQLRPTPLLIHLHQQRASVGAVESTNRTAHFFHLESEKNFLRTQRVKGSLDTNFPGKKEGRVAADLDSIVFRQLAEQFSTAAR